MVIIVFEKVWEGKLKFTNFTVLFLSIRKTCNVVTKRIYECSSCFLFCKLPSCAPSHLFVETLYWRRNWGRRKQIRADRPRNEVVAFYCMMDRPLTILVKLTEWRGRSDMGFCFDFLRLLIWVSWLESSLRRNVQRREDTLYGYRLSSPLSHSWPTLAPTLASVIMVNFSNLFAC